MGEIIISNLPRIFLIVVASAFMFYGILGLINPAGTVEPLSILIENNYATTEIRATYGGLLVGIGLFLFYSSYAECRVGLVSVMLILSAIGLSRLYGIYSDGSDSTIQWQLLSMELIPSVIAVALFLVYYVFPNSKTT